MLLHVQPATVVTAVYEGLLIIIPTETGFREDGGLDLATVVGLWV